MRTLELIMMMGIILGIAGCQANQGVGLGQVESRPMDFSFDLVARSASGEMERVVVFPDGALHYGRGQVEDELPPRVHRLDQEQMDWLWASLGEWRLNQSAQEFSPGVETGDEGYRFTITSRGKRWVVEGPPEDRAFGNLLERLKAVAWVEDEAKRDGRLAHRRYDLGVDPYDRYR